MPIFLIIAADGGLVNGDMMENGNEEETAPKKCDIIIITGKKDNCEAARDALNVSSNLTMTVPFRDFHVFKFRVLETLHCLRF